MALLSCAEGRPSVFLTEYIKTAGHALEQQLVPRHASHFPHPRSPAPGARRGPARDG
jgi:hypothetical protein